MVLRRMGPYPEDHIPKTDLQIVEEVLHEESSSRIGATTSSKQTCSSLPRIQELEQASERYQKDMEEWMRAQEIKYESLRINQEDDLAAIKDLQQKTQVVEKRQEEMDVLLQFILRTQGTGTNALPS